MVKAMDRDWKDFDWKELKIIRYFFQIQENGNMPEGSKLLLEAMKPVQIEAGQDIVSLGASPEDGMYIILEGQANVLTAENMLINELAEGDVVGELALIKDGVRKATVRAVTPVVCANISRSLFLEIADANRKVYAALLELLYTKTTIIVTERERLKSEIEIASRIQTGFLPKSFARFCELPDVQITARMKPAKGVGGDFYDVFLIDETRLCFLAADVSGKGVPAALFMTLAKTHIKNYMMLKLPVAEVAKLVNNRLNEDNEEELFVTAFICVLDTRTNKLTYVNAGHNKPFICRKGEPFSMLECKVDFVLGIMEDMAYREQTTDLFPGDCICLYTDGVTEAFNPEGEMFSDQGMEDTLNRHQKDADAPEIFIEAIYDEVEQFARQEPQSDDITVVYLSRSKKADEVSPAKSAKKASEVSPAKTTSDTETPLEGRPSASRSNDAKTTSDTETPKG